MKKVFGFRRFFIALLILFFIFFTINYLRLPGSTSFIYQEGFAGELSSQQNALQNTEQALSNILPTAQAEASSNPATAATIASMLPAVESTKSMVSNMIGGTPQGMPTMNTANCSTGKTMPKVTKSVGTITNCTNNNCVPSPLFTSGTVLNSTHNACNCDSGYSNTDTTTGIVTCF